MSASNKQKDIATKRQLLAELESSLKWMVDASVDGTNWLSRNAAGKMSETYMPACSHLRPVFKQMIILHGQEELIEERRKLEQLLAEDHEN